MHRFKIIFKSGAVQEIACRQFSVEYDKETGDITSFQAEGVQDTQILHIVLSEIAAIFQLD